MTFLQPKEYKKVNIIFKLEGFCENSVYWTDLVYINIIFPTFLIFEVPFPIFLDIFIVTK